MGWLSRRQASALGSSSSSSAPCGQGFRLPNSALELALIVCRHKYMENAEWDDSRKMILTSIEQAERKRPGGSSRINANLWQVRNTHNLLRTVAPSAGPMASFAPCDALSRIEFVLGLTRTSNPW